MWIPIFRTGTWTDSSGNTRTWTEEDLDRIVERYNPQEHEAPVVIGHPKDNAPAWGWVEALKRDGEVLYAKLKQLVPEFVDMVKRGLFKKRSISLYPDLTLRHIGFLGAMPPAVKGLPDVAFRQGGDEMTIELAEDLSEREKAKKAQEARSKKYGIGIKEGGHVTKPSEWEDVPDEDFLDPVNYRYPCPDADQTRAAARYWGMPRNQQQYTERERAIITRRLEDKMKKFKIGKFKEESNMRERIKKILGLAVENLPEEVVTELDREATFAELEAAKARAEAESKARAEAEAKLREMQQKLLEFQEAQKKVELERRRAEAKAFVDSLKAQGKFLPAWEKLGLIEFMVSLDGDQEIKFSEELTASRSAWFKKFLEQLPKLIEFKEIVNRNAKTQTMSREEFEKLSPAEQMRFVREGGRLDQ